MTERQCEYQIVHEFDIELQIIAWQTEWSLTVQTLCYKEKDDAWNVCLFVYLCACLQHKRFNISNAVRPNVNAILHRIWYD